MSATQTKTINTKMILGHPIGLVVLFFTEMWERFSFYGMRALLALYMEAKPEIGGLGYSIEKAALIYGTYTSAVYLLSMPGGWAADKFLGGRLAVLIGGIIIALGHFSMAFPSETTFFAGLILIVLGTGLLKPNISAMVGDLYQPGATNRDGGFSIFYMGINLGAFFAPLACGFLAQSETFRGFLAARGFDPRGSWHWGFAAAGIGMTFGLIQYLLGRKLIEHVGHKPVRGDGTTVPTLQGFLSYLAVAAGLFVVVTSLQKGWDFAAIAGIGGKTGYALLVTGLLLFGVWQYLKGFPANELKQLVAILFFFIAAALFWAVFEQAGSSLNFFADKYTVCSILGWSFPSSYFQSVNSLFIFFLAPLFTLLWTLWGDKQPSSPLKFVVGLLFAGLGFVVAAMAAGAAGAGKVGPMWLVGVYFIHTIGELCLSPVGLSTMTKLAPARLGGLVMGIWFLGPTVGNFVAGIVAGHFDPKSSAAVSSLFWKVALVAIAGSVLALAISPLIRKLMGNVK